MYAYANNRVITAACGCEITLDVEVDSPSCRCGGGCWDDEYEFEFSDISVTKPCSKHGGSND